MIKRPHNNHIQQETEIESRRSSSTRKVEVNIPFTKSKNKNLFVSTNHQQNSTHDDDATQKINISSATSPGNKTKTV